MRPSIGRRLVLTRRQDDCWRELHGLAGGTCVLLGVAVVVTLEANVGKAAAVFLADYDKRAVAAARAERAAAERASAAEAATR